MNKIPLLDHGYIALVRSWGADECVIEDARQCSNNKGFLGWGARKCTHCGVEESVGRNEPCPEQMPHTFVGEQGDERLLRYLWTNQHVGPLELSGAVFEVQAPLFVLREWRTHRTCSQVGDEYTLDDSFPGDSSYSESSARYAPLPDFNYIPSVARLIAGNDSKNRQAGTIAGADSLTEEKAKWFQSTLVRIYSDAEYFYQAALKAGVPKELARIHLPVGRYSRMRASANLRNWLGFLTLRVAPNAQYEIRVYADAVAGLLRGLFPRTMGLFDEPRKAR